MQTFNYKKISSVSEALANFNSNNGAIPTEHLKFLAGGTSLIDLMKLEVENPKAVVDVNALPLGKIEKQKDGGVLIGATVKNAELAHHEYIVSHYAVLSQALLSGASPQLRNKATTAGNLLQRTRCVYFRDPSKACNKREPKSGCSAIEGFNRNLAILGTSPSCIATNPSDMNVAMMALGATVHLQSARNQRDLAIDEFHLLPGSTPEKESVVQPGELITGVSLAALPPGTKSMYLKLRDRASYEFALASVGIVVTMKSGKVERLRFAMGGLGTKPWRVPTAEKILEGATVSHEKIEAAVTEFLKDAKPQSENGFKVELAKRCLTHGLKQALKA
jgi:xanthine dehydrogenase YagS FAD-binding subunit